MSARREKEQGSPNMESHVRVKRPCICTTTYNVRPKIRFNVHQRRRRERHTISTINRLNWCFPRCLLPTVPIALNARSPHSALLADQNPDLPRLNPKCLYLKAVASFQSCSYLEVPQTFLPKAATTAMVLMDSYTNNRLAWIH